MLKTNMIYAIIYIFSLSLMGMESNSSLGTICYSEAKESNVFKNMFYSTHYGEPGSWIMGSFAYQKGSDFHLFKAKFPKGDYRFVEPEPTIIRIYSTTDYVMQISVTSDYHCPLGGNDRETVYRSATSEFWVGSLNQKFKKVNEHEFEAFKSNFSKSAVESFDKACQNLR